MTPPIICYNWKERFQASEGIESVDKKKKRSITRGIILTILAVAIGYSVYVSAMKEEVEVIKVGSKAPDFELTDILGVKHRLSDFEGQGVVLNFWGTWCAPCEREFPAMENQYADFADKGVEIIAVNYAQSDFEVKKYVQNMGMTFPVAIDKKKSVFAAYNIGPLPTTIFIDSTSKIVEISKGEMSEKQIKDSMTAIMPR